MFIRRVFLLGVIGMTAVAGLFAAPDFNTDRGASGGALGIFLGQPTGITFRYGYGGEQSFEAKAAWDLASYGGSPSFSFQANWLLEFPRVLVIQNANFPLYIGAGLQSDVGPDWASIGFRIPFGIVYRFRKTPLELNLEIGLGMQLFPSTSFQPSGGLGLRYRFK
jgi:hypothetical protein